MLTSLKSRHIIPILLLACTTLTARGADAPKRPPAQIIADINAAKAAVPRYDMEGRLDPGFRDQMTREVAPPLSHLVDLFAELEKASPAQAASLRPDHCLFLAELSLDNDADALKTLTDDSTSAKPAEALFGAVGLLEYHYWNSPNADTQKDVVAQFEKLAKANPREDLLVGSALTMARYHAASDDIASSLRDIVEHDLHGPAALKYQHQPNKIGRLFNVTVPTLGGKPLSIPSWKGKVVLVDFWATWCPGCRDLLPTLVKLYQDNHAKGFEVVGISNDYALADLKQYLAQNKDIVWPQSFSPAGPNKFHTLFYQCSIEGVPTSYLIDRNGILRDIQFCFPDDTKVKQLLDEPAKSDSPTDTGHATGPTTPIP